MVGIEKKNLLNIVQQRECYNPIIEILTRKFRSKQLSLFEMSSYLFSFVCSLKSSASPRETRHKKILGFRLLPVTNLDRYNFPPHCTTCTLLFSSFELKTAQFVYLVKSSCSRTICHLGCYKTSTEEGNTFASQMNRKLLIRHLKTTTCFPSNTVNFFKITK